jgi:hypothetical protein
MILAEEEHHFAKDQASKVNEALQCPRNYVLLPKSAGAEERFRMGAMRCARQTMFD